MSGQSLPRPAAQPHAPPGRPAVHVGVAAGRGASKALALALARRGDARPHVTRTPARCRPNQLDRPDPLYLADEIDSIEQRTAQPARVTRESHRVAAAFALDRPAGAR